MKKDIIIFGCSPFINEIAADIPNLIKNFDTIGLNKFPLYFPQIQHWFFFDDAMLEIVKSFYQGQKLHTRNDLKQQLELAGMDNIEGFTPNSFYCEEVENSLYFKTFTITCAIHWCIRQGYKNVYLAGIDMDDVNWFYFFDKTPKHTPLKTILEGVKGIYFLKNFINVYQLNPANKLDLPKVKIEDLKNGNNFN